MPIAALYDIHGNLPALEAVLDELRRSGVDRIVVGGDVVPGPMPRECLALLRALEIPAQFIRGNGDRVVLAARAGENISGEVPEAFHDVIRWSGTEIDDATAQWMSTWPATLQIEVPGLGKVLFCHATPDNDTDIVTSTTPVEMLTPLFDRADATVVVCGHTHVQFDRTIGRTRVMNAGSVGMSFQGPGAYWLEISGELLLRRTEYDRVAAAARVTSTRYPHAEAFASGNVIQPPDHRAS